MCTPLGGGYRDLCFANDAHPPLGEGKYGDPLKSYESRCFPMAPAQNNLTKVKHRFWQPDTNSRFMFPAD